MLKNGYINADAAYLDFYLALIDAHFDELAHTVRELKNYYAAAYNIFILSPKDLDIQ